MIFSLDPGVSKIGWAITDSDGNTVAYGLETDPCPEYDFNKRMNALINYLIFFYSRQLDNKITHVAWEIVPAFANMNNKDLVQATANTLKVLTFQRDLYYKGYQPREWHKTFTNNPNCSKNDVKNKVLRLEEISDKLSYDVYDAIAIGKVAAKNKKWERASDVS